jgi:hypothetical protein
MSEGQWRGPYLPTPGGRPCNHNCIPLTRRRFLIGPHVTFWRCITCNQDFDEQPFDPWKEMDKLRAEAIDFEQEVAVAQAPKDYFIEEEP